MENLILATFPQCTVNHCLDIIADVNFGILDDTNQQKCCIATVECADFFVENTTERPIHFLAIDHCIWNNSCGHQKCDFALYNEDIFCLVELKCKTYSTKKKAKTRRKEAIEQIEATVDRFYYTLNLSRFSILEAYIAVGKGKVEQKPKLSASNQAARLRLKTKYGLDKIYEGHKKEFI